MSKLKLGLIPANEVCPFASECYIKHAGDCKHAGVKHQVPFSCAAARGFDMGSPPVPTAPVRAHMNSQHLLEELTEAHQFERVSMTTVHPIQNIGTGGLGKDSTIAQRVVIVDGITFLVQVVQLSKVE